MKKLSVILVLSILFVATTLAQKITGVVYLADQPVKNAKVSNLDNGKKVKTDENGYFVLSAELDANLLVKYKATSLQTSLKGIDAYVDIVLIPSEKDFYKLIKANPSVKKCELFIAHNSESKYLNEINSVLEEQTFIDAYDNAVANYNLSELKNYVANYPNGKFAAKASKTIDIISWQKAKSQDTMQAYNTYLNNFPNGEAVSLAKSRVAMLTE